MIRQHTPEDLEVIMDIWYRSSSLAHPFLSSEFVDKVKADMANLYIPGSDTWVYTIDDAIVGFLSMMGNEIGGLFVDPDKHAKGIGSKMVDFICSQHPTLEVEVFEKNQIGRAFYSKYGFKQIKSYTHNESGFEVLRLKYEALHLPTSTSGNRT